MMSNNYGLSLFCMATLALVTAQQEFHTIGIGGRYGKRSEDSQPIYLPDNQLSSRSTRTSMFWSGSRYGRGFVPEVHQARLEVEPRADRFFMGSRYGKRNDILSSDVGDALLQDQSLSCQYTGIVDLYRCINRKVINENVSEEDDLNT